MQENSLTGPADFDPAAPQSDEEGLVGVGLESANFGEDGRGNVPPGEEGLDGLEGAGPSGHALLIVDIGKAKAFLQECMTSDPRVRYGLGAKIKPGAVPGSGFKSVDCSGFVREAIRRSTDLGTKFPDGSVVQHDWVADRGFQKVARSEGTRRDGAVRIAFLRPIDSPKKIGHVVLLYDGATLESHGGVGPNSRPWTVQGWQSKAHVYVLASVG